MNNQPMLPLDGSVFANTKTSHPRTSRRAADSMNEGDKLTKQLTAVLLALKANDGVSAKRLGEIMSQAGVHKLEWSHKRMSQLEELGYVRREEPENGKELICFVTEKGKNF